MGGIESKKKKRKMSVTMSRDDLARSLSRGSTSRRLSLSLSSASASVREVFSGPGGDAFHRSSRREDDEEELKWAAIERLPTYDRLRKGILTQVLDDGRIVGEEVDVANLGLQERKQLMESILKVVDEDNERFLQRLRDRTDR